MNHINERLLIRLCLNLDNSAPVISGIKSTCQNPLDWDYILKKANEKSITPIVYSHLKGLEKDTVPTPVLNSLKTAYLMTRLRNERFLAELEGILKNSEEEKISILLLKGIALINTPYKDMGLRPMTDIDILIHPRDVARFEKMVFRLGFKPGPGAFFYVKDNHWSVPLDVHTDIWYIDSLDEFWNTALEVKIGDARALMMQPQETVIYLAAHASVYHGNIRDIQLIDIYETIKAHRSQINWEGIVNKIIKYNIDVPLYYVFKQLQERLDAEVPYFVLERLNPKNKKKIQKWLYESILDSASLIDIGHILHPFIYRGIRKKIKFTISFLFPTREFMLRRYKIKNRTLVYFYYLYRLASHAGRIMRLAKKLFLAKQFKCRNAF